jgi:hypothetical protein
VPDDEVVFICGEENHHPYHRNCLTVQGLGETSNCPRCLDMEREYRLSPPCAVCGERVRGTAWSIDGKCEHGVHGKCLDSWDAGRIVGCIVCHSAKIVCPICRKPCQPGHRHDLVRCRECKARVIEQIADDHDCACALFNDRPCLVCGEAEKKHDVKCRVRIKAYLKWGGSGFLYACPLCDEYAADLGSHFKTEHRALRCRRCTYVINKSAGPTHVAQCDGAKFCPADGCRAVVSGRMRKISKQRPNLLVEDHDCRGLYECLICHSFFLSADDLEEHATNCLPNGRESKRRRRTAFDVSNEVVLATGAIRETDQ